MEGLCQKLVASDVRRKEFTENDFNVKFTCEPMIPRSNKKNKKFKFTAYAYQAFNIVRNEYGMTNRIFMDKLGITELLSRLTMRNFSSLKSMMSQGKSGAFFMQSPDSSLILKTVSKDE